MSARSCSSREGARHRWRGRPWAGDACAARARGLRGRVARSDDRLRRHRPRGVGARRASRSRLSERGHPHRAHRTRQLSYADYRQAVSVNVDGVVLGVRRLAQVMDDGAIVATASLAGLVGMPHDAIYSLTKHAVVGFVRSIAATDRADQDQRDLSRDRRHADARPARPASDVRSLRLPAAAAG